MVDFKQIEKECYQFLIDSKEFDSVEWLSEISYSPVDFKAYKEGIEYMIEGKYIDGKKVHLSPNQSKVDAVVLHNGKDIKLLWRKDWGKIVNLGKGAIVKLSIDTKAELDQLKIHPRQTYEEIIRKLLEKSK